MKTQAQSDSVRESERPYVSPYGVNFNSLNQNDFQVAEAMNRQVVDLVKKIQSGEASCWMLKRSIENIHDAVAIFERHLALIETNPDHIETICGQPCSRKALWIGTAPGTTVGNFKALINDLKDAVQYFEGVSEDMEAESRHCRTVGYVALGVMGAVTAYFSYGFRL